MRSITRQKCVDRTGLFAALVTSDCSYRDRVTRWWLPGTNLVGAAGGYDGGECGGLMLAVHFPRRRISGIPDYV